MNIQEQKQQYELLKQKASEKKEREVQNFIAVKVAQENLINNFIPTLKYLPDDIYNELFPDILKSEIETKTFLDFFPSLKADINQINKEAYEAEFARFTHIVNTVNAYVEKAYTESIKVLEEYLGA